MVHHFDGPHAAIRFAPCETLVERGSKGKDVDWEREWPGRVDQLRWGERQCSKADPVGGRMRWMDKKGGAKVG